MKKLLLCIACLFLLTGCSITYNLNIDKKFKENISIIEANPEYFNYEMSGTSLNDAKNYYLKMPVTLYNNAPHYSESFDKIPGIYYYNVKDLTNANEIGLSFDGIFKNYSKYSDSNMVWYASRLNVEKNDNKITILVDNFKIFKKYINLDKLTVNVKVNYLVSESNADSVNGNVYTWVITRPNYNSKTIKLIYKTKLDVVNDLEKSDSLTLFILVLLGLVIAGLIIFKFVQAKFKKKNSL
jgi:hypothetical protein